LVIAALELLYIVAHIAQVDLLQRAHGAFWRAGFPVSTEALRMSQIRHRCQVCRHEERWRIELLRAGGASIDALAAKFNVDRDAIWRHWKRHVSDEAKAGYLCGPIELGKLAERAAEEGGSILDYLAMARTSLVAQLAAMNEAGDARGVVYVAAQLTRTLEAIGRCTGEIGTLATNVNITNNTIALVNSPQFAQVQGIMLRALAPYPDARLAVVDALRALDAENAPAPLSVNPAKVIEHVA
jgi:hypothetical protein